MEPEVDPLPQGNLQPPGLRFRDAPQLRVVTALMSGKAGAERVLVRSDQRVRAEPVDVVGDQHQVAGRETSVRTPAGGVGQDDRLHAEPRQHPGRENDVGHRPAFVEMDPPGEHDDGRLPDVAEDELSRVARRRRSRSGKCGIFS